MKNEKCRKDVFMAVRWGVRLMPALLMVGHWCLVAAFHRNPWEITVDAGGNELCVAAVWVMVWALPMAVLWSAGRLFGFGRVWKIPFGYALGVMAVRAAYGVAWVSGVTRAADYGLIVAAMLAYCIAAVWARDGRT